MTVIAAERLVISFVGADEALHRDWLLDPPNADLVRVRNPDPAARGDLEAAGFVVTPGWVNWIARLGESEEQFLAGLAPGERKEIRRGRRMTDRQGISLSVRHGIGQEDLERFLDLYDRQIARMTHGVNFARRQLRRIRGDQDRLIAGFAHAGDTLVAGCLGWVGEDGALLQLRFSATDPSGRAAGAVRGIYLAMFQAARERGCAWISLGNDPALYGYTVQPGLFTFKSRLGFTPVPSRAVNEAAPADEADLFLNLAPLARPSLLLAHHEDSVAGPVPLAQAPRLRAVVLSDASPCDLSGYRAAPVAAVEHRFVPAGPRHGGGE